MKKLLWLFLLFPTVALGQGVQVQGVAQRTVQGFVAPIPGAQITACTSAGTGTPCTPTTPIYTDAGLTQLITGSTLTADSNGNFVFYAPASQTIKYSITATGVTGQLFTVVLPIVGGGVGTFTNLTASGAGAFTGGFTANSINNVQMCDQFAGATADLKIAACITALPTNGGTADARGLQGAQSFASTLVINKTVTLLLGAAKITGPASGAIIDVQAPGVVIKGSGSMQNTGASQGTVLIATTATQGDGIHLSATGSGNVQYKVQDLTVNDSTAGGTARTAGAGIHADANASPAQNSIGEVDNVYVSFMFYGVFINRPITSIVQHTTAVQSKQDDFDFQGDGTSMWCIGCYGNFSGRNNFSWFGINYGGCIGCASDHAVKDGYHIARQTDASPSSGTQSISISITNTGAEADCTSGAAGCAGIHDIDSVGVYISGIKVLNSTGYGVWVDGTRAVNLSGIITGSTSPDVQVNQSTTNGQNVAPAAIVAQNLQYATSGGAAFAAQFSNLGWTGQSANGNAWYQFAYPLWLTEEAAPSAGQANIDLCYGDSTAHAVKCSYNNGSFFNQTQTIASGTIAMTTALIGAGACGSGVSSTATGTLTTDAIVWSFNAAPGSNPTLTVNPWPTANNVNFLYCNPSAGGVTPAAATINWRVVR